VLTLNGNPGDVLLYRLLHEICGLWHNIVSMKQEILFFGEIWKCYYFLCELGSRTSCTSSNKETLFTTHFKCMGL